MNTKLVAIVGTAAAIGLVAGCGGSTGGGSDSGSGVGINGSSSGSISISLSESELAVANTMGFFASLTDADGRPGAAGTRIVCDSEDGVAIIEPSTGSEITGSGGEISGRIGCEAPGSYQFVCRLPSSSGRTASVTVKCTGTAPTGFNGFGGSGGGNLGGGNGDGVTDFDPTKVRITGINFEDVGKEVDGTIDTAVIVDCDSETDGNQTEPFTDAFVKFTINNQSGQTINFTSFTYTVPDFSGTTDLDSSRVDFTGNNGLTIASGDSGTLKGFFTRANGGVKNFIGSSVAIGELGFRNITFTVTGITDSGEEVEMSASAGATLQDYNNCAD